MKGVSPLVASVLLIAFTIAVAGLYSGWITSFTKKTNEEVEEQSGKKSRAVTVVSLWIM